MLIDRYRRIAILILVLFMVVCISGILFSGAAALRQRLAPAGESPGTVAASPSEASSASDGTNRPALAEQPQSGDLRPDPAKVVSNAGENQVSGIQTYENTLPALTVVTNPAGENTAKPSNSTEHKGPGAKAVPILYYHAVNDDITGLEELFVSPSEFEKQMKYLKDDSYSVITFKQLKDISTIEKPVIITFDDGYEDNYTYAYPILKKYGFKATVFLCCDVVDKPLFLKKNQIEEIKELVNIQSHTVTHRKLSELKSGEIEEELSDSKKILEQLTGTQVDALAYPYGDYDGRVIETAKKYYKYAVISGGGIYHEGDDSYEIKRVYIPRELNLEGFIKKIKGE